jgi:hypothetical protein
MERYERSSILTELTRAKNKVDETTRMLMEKSTAKKTEAWIKSLHEEQLVRDRLLFKHTFRISKQEKKS